LQQQMMMMKMIPATNRFSSNLAIGIVILGLACGESFIQGVHGEEVEEENAWLWQGDSALLSSATSSSNSDDDHYDMMDGVWSVSVSTNNRNNQSTTTTAATTKTTTVPFGYANLHPQSPIPMTAHHRFPVASNSKLYTAVAVYQLHERGLLDVDADIASLLSQEDFENFGYTKLQAQGLAHTFCFRLAGPLRHCQKLTLRHVLGMSSGIYPTLNCNAAPHAACHRAAFILSLGSIGRTVGTFLTEPLGFRPGTQFQYSNSNFILATYLVEKYSGLYFRDYLQTHIFAPLGLENSYYDFFNQALQMDPLRPEQYAKYYDNATNELIAIGKDGVQLDLGIASGTGGILATVQDLATFWYAVFDRDTQGAPLFASPASQKALLHPWTLVGQGAIVFPNNNNTRQDVWQYYTQGTVILCFEPKCQNQQEPRFVLYEGGTVTVHTANILDLATRRMAQVWTSTLILSTDRSTYQETVDRQTGAWFPDVLVKLNWTNRLF